MKAVKLLGVSGGFGALLCMTGFDCPECNFEAQTIALVSCIVVALVCGIIEYRKENER